MAHDVPGQCVWEVPAYSGRMLSGCQIETPASGKLIGGRSTCGQGDHHHPTPIIQAKVPASVDEKPQPHWRTAGAKSILLNGNPPIQFDSSAGVKEKPQLVRLGLSISEHRELLLRPPSLGL